MRYSTVILTIAAAGVLFTSCGHKEEKVTEVAPIKVEVAVANGGGALVESRQYSGTVESGDAADMSFTVGGTVKGIYVSPGQKVSKGQLLAEIDAGNLQNAYQVAQTALEQARDAYNRFKKLHDADALPDIQWVDVQSKLRQAENAEAIARRSLGDARIYSPVDGVVSEKLSEVGQMVAPGVPVVKIVSIGDVKVNISVPEAEIGVMKPGIKATVKADIAGAGELVGVLSEQGVVANPLSRTYDVKFRVPNTSGVLRPGMLCNVNVAAPAPDRTPDDAAKIVIPANAVLLCADNRQFVWLAKAGKAERRFVKTGTLLPDGVEITEGLASGDAVIVSGMQKICNGTKIKF